MIKINLFGASGQGKVVKEIAEINNILVESFLDDDPNLSILHETPVITFNEIYKYNGNDFIISIGNNRFRRHVSEKLKANFASISHPSAIISPKVTISEGTVIMASVVINSSVVIGKHVIVNTATVIEHDCIIGDFVHISPNATLTGNINIGEGTHIGAGAIIIPNITIGKWVTIGAGAVIIKDIPDYAVVVGNPGKIIKYNS